MEDIKRPVPVTIVSVLLLVFFGFSLIMNLISMGNPMVEDLLRKIPVDINLQYVIMYASMALMIISAVGMLMGKKWSRIIYIAVVVFTIAYSVYTTGLMDEEFQQNSFKSQIITTLVYVAVGILLFLPKKTRLFFNQSDEY